MQTDRREASDDTCHQIETDYDLRQLKKGDRTAGRRPTQAEMLTAERLDCEQISREWLRGRIRAAIPHAGNPEELLAYFEADGIAIKSPQSARRPSRLHSQPPRQSQ